LATVTKKRKEVLEKLDKTKLYTLNEASSLVKDITTTKFDASVDLDIRLGVDPRKPNQMVRGSVTMPHGTGKDVRVLVLCNEDREKEATNAGADYVGLDDYLQKIDQGWTDVDVIITTPDVMPKLGKYGKTLGPRGLMPNPKSGTVTDNLGDAVTQTKAGKVDFRVDRYGIIHTGIGKVSFDAQKLHDNALELIQEVSRLKPSSAKGEYFRSINMSSSMSPSVKIDKRSIPGI
jgi:large subunit ribosomal protein L1